MAFYSSKDSVFGIVDTEAIIARALDGAVYTNQDAAAANATANDMTLLPAIEEVNDAYHFRATGKFCGVLLNVGTAGVGSAITWEYYTGASSVATLTISDQSAGFTASGLVLITFDPPSNWVSNTIDGHTGCGIRARCSTASFTTQPLGTQAWLVKDLSPYIVSIDGLPGERELSEVTALGDGGRKFIPGLENIPITLEMRWSDDAGGGPDTVLGPLRTHISAVHFHYGPEGRATGDVKYSGTCWVRNYVVGARTATEVTARVELQVDGQVARSTFT